MLHGLPEGAQANAVKLSVMNIHGQSAQKHFESVARLFLERFDTLPSSGTPELFLGETLLVGGPNGYNAITRSDFVGAVSKRANGVGAVTPKLVRFTAVPLGSHYGLVTATWELTVGAADDEQTLLLTSDFILDRSSREARCVAYLARQDLLKALEDLDRPNPVEPAPRRRGQSESHV